MSVLLDTHIWIWWLTGDPALKPAERTALGELARRNALHISAISLWETQVLNARGRITLPLDLSDWLERATDERVVRLEPLDVTVIRALDALPRTFHGDPADRLIVATARARSLQLASRDDRIRRSKLVSLWSVRAAARADS